MTHRTMTLAAAFAALSLAAPAMAQDVQYELTNSTGLTVIEFFTSPVTDAAWGEDILGTQILGPGEAGVVTIADGAAHCQYDFQFVLEDGSVIEDQADICATASFELVAE